MSQQKDDKANGSLGYQTKNNEEVNGIVERLNTPRKRYEPKNPDRRRKVEPKMSEAEIQEMVQRLHSSKAHPRPKSAYEQGGVMLSYWNTGWDRPGTGGKRY
ncbi:Hypothetical predicted protein [Paramuricea clavata]|uniref:Uncharacterized protein n=1 Tax=Paramuricea clavata TaxID=317549 RepID=A0A6S7FWG6_PARCT|nr:Hypothetical predicted protein [Paramuricea clavata]